MSANQHFLRSATNPNIGYLLGIIDYFQLYTFQKSAERFFKRLMKCNPKLDTSSQPPLIYSTRFIDWTQKIISAVGILRSEVEMSTTLNDRPDDIKKISDMIVDDSGNKPDVLADPIAQ